MRNNGFSTAVPAFVCMDYIETNPTTQIVVIGTTARYRSVVSRFSLILSRVSLWGQPHIPGFYTMCLMWCSTFGKEKYCSEIFLRSCLAALCGNPISIPRGCTGMVYEEAMPPPFFSGFWAPYPDFVIPLSFHLKLVCKPHFTWFWCWSLMLLSI